MTILKIVTFDVETHFYTHKDEWWYFNFLPAVVLDFMRYGPKDLTHAWKFHIAWLMFEIIFELEYEKEDKGGE